MNFANLHLHSTYSDAGFTPTQLVCLGKALGYKALALTDHETDGGNDEFFRVAKREEIQIISGAEFYGHLNGKKMHLTALDFDREAPELRALVRQRCDLQAQWTKSCLELGLNGIEVDPSGIAPEVLPLCDQAAQKYNLYRCGGTDHTGPMSCCCGKYARPV